MERIKKGKVSEGTTEFDGITTAHGESPLSGSRVFLLIHKPEGVEVRQIEEGDDITLGRSEEASIPLDDGQASRLHSRIRRKNGAVIVEDLGSRNGTKINGNRIFQSSRPVLGGDVVVIGKTEIVIAQSAGGAPMASPEVDDASIVIADPAMQKVHQIASRLALTQTTVLILGETGVGKEVIAETIHRGSARKTGPFVRLTCASLPETLLESELFGHERGAFTNAVDRKIGYLEAAHTGTLFLDEIGEMSLATQVKLLAALESRTIARLGGRQEIAVDVRIICATNKNLRDEVNRGRFREDLFYRINTFTLEVPPLRERKAEILLLAELFARRFSRLMNVAHRSIEQDARSALLEHSWPGNVRELRNAIEHAVVLSDRGSIHASHLPPTVLQPPDADPRAKGATGGASGPLKDQVFDVEKKSIEEALAAENGNQTRAAKRLGISRRALIYKLEKYGLKR
jgi:transcriptional regulator with PAS, ATPase and Fis domain